MQVIEWNDSKVGFIIVLIELICSLCLHALALYLLVRKKKKTIAALLLIHLSCCEICIAVWVLINYSLHIYWKRSVESDVNITGQIVIWASIIQTVLCITLDRVAAVRFPYKYKIIRTRAKLFVILIAINLISFAVGLTFIFTDSYKFLTPIGVSFASIVILGSYSYILVAFRRRRRSLNNHSSRVNVPKIKYKIPLSIALSILCCMLIPSLVLQIDNHLYSIWIHVIWYLEIICDPLIYVVGSRRKSKPKDPSNSREMENQRRITAHSSPSK